MYWAMVKYSPKDQMRKRGELSAWDAYHGDITFASPLPHHTNTKNEMQSAGN